MLVVSAPARERVERCPVGLTELVERRTPNAQVSALSAAHETPSGLAKLIPRVHRYSGQVEFERQRGLRTGQPSRFSIAATSVVGPGNPVRTALEGVEAGYDLVHSMGSQDDFKELGSRTFELSRSLVERLPVMATPGGASVKAELSTIRDLAAYFGESRAPESAAIRVFEVDGPDHGDTPSPLIDAVPERAVAYQGIAGSPSAVHGAEVVHDSGATDGDASNSLPGTERPMGVEPTTLGLGSWALYQLSYGREPCRAWPL